NWLATAAPAAPPTARAEPLQAAVVRRPSSPRMRRRFPLLRHKSVIIAASVLLLVVGGFVVKAVIDTPAPRLENKLESSNGLTRAVPPTSPAAKGPPLTPLALVAQPCPIEGVQGWTLEPLRRFGPIRAVAYSPDGQLLASTANSGRVDLWD